MPSEVRFAEIRKRLESDGWKLDRINGSHHMFEHPTKGSLSIPVHRGKVKPIYVKKVEKAIGGR